MRSPPDGGGKISAASGLCAGWGSGLFREAVEVPGACNGPAGGRGEKEGKTKTGPGVACISRFCPLTDDEDRETAVPGASSGGTMVEIPMSMARILQNRILRAFSGRYSDNVPQVLWQGRCAGQKPREGFGSVAGETVFCMRMGRGKGHAPVLFPGRTGSVLPFPSLPPGCGKCMRRMKAGMSRKGLRQCFPMNGRRCGSHPMDRGSAGKTRADSVIKDFSAGQAAFSVTAGKVLSPGMTGRKRAEAGKAAPGGSPGMTGAESASVH